MLADRRISVVNGQLADRMKNLAQKGKPTIEITLNDEQQESFIPSYTSLDTIKGQVSISTSSDTSFDDIYITFEGAVRTFVEKIASSSPTNGRTEAFQSFLRLVQPMDSDSFPESRVLEAGKIYKFPFTFVVPERLLPQSCTHPKEHTFPDGAHLALPPSLGDPMVASMGKSLMDDMAPDMGTIAYAIKCRITSGRGATGKIRILTEGSKKLRIIPAVPEAPPLSVEGGMKDDYRLRKEKSMRKGLFKSKLGCLVMESVQPQSLRLPSARSNSECAVTTMATVNVRFDPADENCQPPRLNTLQTKLKVATFFASLPMQELPSKSSDFHYSSVRGIFVDAINLSSRCLANQKWEKHDASTLPASRDTSELSTSESKGKIPMPSSAYRGKSFYTAQIVVPVSLPKGNKVFVPSFHSCLISRIYALDLYLSLNTPKASVSDPTLHLKLPIQVSSEGNPSARPTISAEEANAIASREANDFFSPRNVAPPNPELTEQAQLDAPPSPGPGWTHRTDLSHLQNRPIPEYSVRMNGTQQRFQSLCFENEERESEREEEALAPPPGYSTFGGSSRNRVQSNVPIQHDRARLSMH
ncbi:hypothetical protein ACLMJK_008448 [Lecanora helva]